MALSAFVIRILLLAIPGILASKVYKKLRGRPIREAWETFIEIMIFSLASYAIVHALGLDGNGGAGTALTVTAIPPFTIQSPQPVPFLGPPEYSVPATQPTSISAQPGSPGKPVAIRVANPVTIASTQPVMVQGAPPVAFAPNQTVTIQPAQSSSPSSSIFEAFLNDQLPLGGYVGTICWSTVIALALAVLASYLHNFGVVNAVGRFIHASRRTGDEDAWTSFNNSDDVQWVNVYDFANDRVYFGSVNGYSDSEKQREIVLENVQVYQKSTDKLLYCLKAVYLSRDNGAWTVEIPADTPSAPAG